MERHEVHHASHHHEEKKEKEKEEKVEKVERTEVHHASHHHDEKKEEEKEEESHHADLALRESSATKKKQKKEKDAELGKDAKKDDSVRSVHFLDPSDALFQSLGAAFTKQLVEDFGTDHLYLADTFREIRDPNDDFSETHVARVGAATLAAMRSADPRATWVFQSDAFRGNPGSGTRIAGGRCFGRLTSETCSCSTARRRRTRTTFASPCTSPGSRSCGA